MSALVSLTVNSVSTSSMQGLVVVVVVLTCAVVCDEAIGPYRCTKEKVKRGRRACLVPIEEKAELCYVGTDLKKSLKV